MEKADYFYGAEKKSNVAVDSTVWSNGAYGFPGGETRDCAASGDVRPTLHEAQHGR